MWQLGIWFSGKKGGTGLIAGLKTYESCLTPMIDSKKMKATPSLFVTHSCVSSKLTFPEHGKVIYLQMHSKALKHSNKPVHCQISGRSFCQRSSQLQLQAESPCSWRRHSRSCMASSSPLSPCTLASHSALLNSAVPSSPPNHPLSAAPGSLTCSQPQQHCNDSDLQKYFSSCFLLLVSQLPVKLKEQREVLSIF